MLPGQCMSLISCLVILIFFSYFKYGAFGVVAGHELTHGFDDQGNNITDNGGVKVAFHFNFQASSIIKMVY